MIESRNETKAPEEGLNGFLVKQVVVNAVLGLVHQPALLGNEVPDGLIEKYLMCQDQDQDQNQVQVQDEDQDQDQYEVPEDKF